MRARRPDDRRVGAGPGPVRAVAVAFTLMLVAVGTGFSYGVLAVPLGAALGAGRAGAAGVFSLTVATFFLTGALWGPLADRWGAGRVLLLGAPTLGAGLALTASASSLPQVYLGHGLLVGAGMGTTFVPLVALVGASARRRRALALGLAVSGIGVGTLVMAPAIAAAIAAVGWRTAYAGLAVAGTVALAAGGLVLRAAGAPTPVDGPAGDPRAGAGGDRRAGPPVRERLRTADFRLLYGAQALLAVALFLPFAHLPALAAAGGAPPVLAAGLVGLVGASSVVGRLVLGPVADRWGALATYRWCFAAVGASFLPWLVAAARPGERDAAGLLVVHAAVFGVGYGGFVALLPAVVADRFGVAGLGGLVGVLYTANVVGASAGPWGTGLLADRWGYAPAGVAGFACALAGAALLLHVRRPAPRTARAPA